MKNLILFIFLLLICETGGFPQNNLSDKTFKLALPAHLGQLEWARNEFKAVEFSAKPRGQEIGVRARDESGRAALLTFLFLPDVPPPATSAKCRDGALNAMKGAHLRDLGTSEMLNAENVPLELANYSAKSAKGQTVHSIRAFIAAGEVCGDFEFYSDDPISPDDSVVKTILQSIRLDAGYTPQFQDIFLYAQILYSHHAFQAAAPIFEQALSKLGGGNDQLKMRRVTIDQAGMAYGMSGDIPKARSLFEAAIAKDPAYPMYYYNLACADAEEKKLADARTHLTQAFDRRANVISGEAMPDPTKDDSFLPYRGNKEFWAFIESLR